MIIGLDQLLNLNKWKNYDKIIQSVNIYCFNRDINGYKISDIYKNINFIEKFNYEISSTIIFTPGRCSPVSALVIRPEIFPPEAISEEINNIEGMSLRF